MAERVLAVPRETLFAGGKAFEGFLPASSFDFTERILADHRFLLRKTTDAEQDTPAEEDPRFKQIIPYCLFAHDGKLFVYRRLQQGGEQRLHDLRSVGIGGHINPPDTEADDILITAMLREFHEEMVYEGDFTHRLIGFINDEGNDVGKVHFGLVYLLQGSSPEIDVRETENLAGELVELGAIGELEDFEGWSRICLDHLTHHQSVLEGNT